MSTLPDLPIPSGAVADRWWYLDDTDPAEAFRCLTWERVEVAGIVVGLEGVQFGNGCVDRFVVVEKTIELSCAADVRRLAAALLGAADSLEAHASVI